MALYDGISLSKVLDEVVFPLDHLHDLVYTDRNARLDFVQSKNLEKYKNSEFIDANKLLQVRRTAAAIMIQAIWRSHVVQVKYTCVHLGHVSKLTVGSTAGVSQLRLELAVQERVLVKYRKYADLCERQGSVPPFFDEFCAIKIQSVWWMRRARRASGLVIENTIRNVFLLAKNPNVPATRIQRLWRKYWGRKVFQSIRELVRARERDSCRRVLATVNPKESHLADIASGMHVRFRLGGESFPPCLYYKVYNHRPTVDIGAFAPRNYVDPSDPHKEKYYQRFENNGWRPVFNEDSLYSKSSQQRIHYPPLRSHRRISKELRQKQRKLDWFNQLYGISPDDPVSWIDQLDFDKYCHDWTLLATTLVAPGYRAVMEPHAVDGCHDKDLSPRTGCQSVDLI